MAGRCMRADSCTSQARGTDQPSVARPPAACEGRPEEAPSTPQCLVVTLEPRCCWAFYEAA